jgi:hypothetical protein
MAVIAVGVTASTPIPASDANASLEKAGQRRHSIRIRFVGGERR